MGLGLGLLSTLLNGMMQFCPEYLHLTQVRWTKVKSSAGQGCETAPGVLGSHRLQGEVSMSLLNGVRLDAVKRIQSA